MAPLRTAPRCAAPLPGRVTLGMCVSWQSMRLLARRGLTVLMLVALWLPSIDAALHGALSSHQWLRHVESSDGCHAERCALGMALAERAMVAAPADPVPVRLVSQFDEPPIARQRPLPERSRSTVLPRSPPSLIS